MTKHKGTSGAGDPGLQNRRGYSGILSSNEKYMYAMAHTTRVMMIPPSALSGYTGCPRRSYKVLYLVFHLYGLTKSYF